MRDKQEFIDAMDLQQDADGHWFVNGVVWGSVNGSVNGSVYGSVGGDVWGTIYGRKWKFVENNDEK